MAAQKTDSAAQCQTTAQPASATNPEGFTEIELAELKDRPVTVEWREYTEEQLAVRVAAAKKVCAYFNRVDHTMSAEARRVYERLPMWGFYVDDGLPKRVYGVLTCSSCGSDSLHTASSLVLFTNLTVTPSASLVRVDRWSDEQKGRLRLGVTPGTFLDPLGFMNVLGQESR